MENGKNWDQYLDEERLKRATTTLVARRAESLVFVPPCLISFSTKSTMRTTIIRQGMSYGL